MLLERLNNDIITALKGGEKKVLSTLRMVKAAIQRFELDNKTTLDDAGIIDVINKQIKTREDSIREFTKGNRQDLIDQTQSEIDLLRIYMPTPLTDDEVAEIINQAISETNATGIKDLGQIMKQVTPIVKGKYDLSKITNIIKEKLK